MISWQEFKGIALIWLLVPVGWVVALMVRVDAWLHGEES